MLISVGPAERESQLGVGLPRQVEKDFNGEGEKDVGNLTMAAEGKAQDGPDNAGH